MTFNQPVLPAEHPEGIGPKSNILLTFLGLAGIVSLFLPFADDESPISAALGLSLWRVALPFSLAVLVSAAAVRRLATGTTSRVESAAGYTAAAAVACVTLSLYVSGITPSGFRDWASLAAGLVTFAAGGFVVVKNWRMGVPHALNCLVSMQVAYLANSLLCLVAFLGEWQVGAYLTLLTALVYVAEITIASRTSPRSSHAGG